MFSNEVTQHGKWFLSLLDYRNKGYLIIGDRRLQFKRGRFGICDVGNNEQAHTSQNLDRFGKISFCGSLEVKYYRQQVMCPHFFCYGVEDNFSFRSKTTQN